MEIKRNNTIEFIKLIASYMVVFIHVLCIYSDSVIANSLARFAVPFFFAISGFFAYNASVDVIKKRMKNIIFLAIISFFLHTFWNMIYRSLYFGQEFVGAYFAQYLEFETWKKILLYNVPVSTGVAWYLLAMIYVYTMFYFITKRNVNLKIIAVVAAALLAINLILSELYAILGIRVESHVVRNFLLTGFPFFTFGLLSRKYVDKLRKIPNYILALLFIIGVAETLLSATYFGIRELYVGSVLILIALIVIVVKYPRYDSPMMPAWLYGCSTYIYIIHTIIDGVITGMYRMFNVDYLSINIMRGIHPLFVCIISTCLAYLLKNMSVQPTWNQAVKSDKTNN